MFDIEEITNKWYELGFLEQMPENLKPVLALKYELVANYVVSHDSYMGNTTLSNVIFPIVYRIYKKGKTIPNVESFIRQGPIPMLRLKFVLYLLSSGNHKKG